ncbi:hypothetical protein Q2462_26700, partial [Escherichia coli]|nr:hypothetical protein [Escherichia coli]
VHCCPLSFFFQAVVAHAKLSPLFMAGSLRCEKETALCQEKKKKKKKTACNNGKTTTTKKITVGRLNNHKKKKKKKISK